MKNRHPQGRWNRMRMDELRARTTSPSPRLFSLRKLAPWMGLGLLSCLGGDAPFFPIDGQAPRIEIVYRQDDSTLASQPELMGGYRVVIRGTNLVDDHLSVRFGDRAAEILARYDDGVEQSLTVASPPGPLWGGTVPISVAHAGGIQTFPDAYTYERPDRDLYRGEFGSMQVVLQADDPPRAFLGAWDSPFSGAALNAFADVALYRMPLHESSAYAWPTEQAPAQVDREPTGSWLESVMLGESDALASLRLAWDPVLRRFVPCSNVDPASWSEGTSLELDVSGSGLKTSASSALSIPPGVGEGGVPVGLEFSGTSAEINLEAGVHLAIDPWTDSDADARYDVLEIVYYDPDTSFAGMPRILADRIVRGDPATGILDMDASLLDDLQVVNTTCALLARELEVARAAGTVPVNTIEDEYIAAGCRDDESPSELYPLAAALRIARHGVYRIEIDPSEETCAHLVGDCSNAAMIVDLVSLYEVDLNTVRVALPDCADGIDNDLDGMIDLDDHGCGGADDPTEVDETGRYLCDDGLDNDGDGTADYRLDDSADPGCSSPTDITETGDGVCDDGIDNDGDGLSDFRLDNQGDPGCTSLFDDGEHADTLPCDDGLDNDGDGFADYQQTLYVGDPGCEDPTDPDEVDSTGTWPCDDGIDNELDGLIDADDRGCYLNPPLSSTYTPWELDEYNPNVECDNNIDDDGDGRIDYRVDGTGDNQCLGANDDSEQ